jgi:hypothetical protein
MMKITALLIVGTVWLAQEKDPAKIVKVEFTSLTRGYQESITFTTDSIRGSKPVPGDRSKVTVINKAMKKQDWKHLVEQATSIPRAEFESLKSPTEKRAFDGAKHSTIVITLQNGDTYLHLFDDETPNEKLVPLMKCISKLRDQATQ